MTSGLRKRARSYLNVPSATVTDGRLSFKARGILAYLLDKPAGWDVRSVSIAADSQADGKAAVQAGLRELARAGYYRIERRRLLDGRLVTGTAVSEEPVASWAAQYAEYQGPVPVMQQSGGSFRVMRKDGSLTGDGFTAETGPDPRAAGTAVGETAEGGDGGVSAGRTGTRFSGAGVTGSGQTGAGPAGSGKLGAFINTEEPLQRPSPHPPAACGTPRLPVPGRGRGTKIRIPQRDWMPWSPRSARSGRSGHPARFAVLWPTLMSLSAAGTVRGGRCSPSPPILSRSSPVGWPTVARGGPSRAHPGPVVSDRRGAAGAAMSVRVRSTCPMGLSAAARPAIRWPGRLREREPRHRYSAVRASYAGLDRSPGS